MDILAVFAKQPAPGKVKTRLAASLGSETAADVYRAFLEDLFERFRTIAEERVVAYTPDGARGFFERFAGAGYGLVEQGDGDLGERMRRLFEKYLSRRQRPSQSGDARVVIIGSDSPTLPRERVQDAFALLAEHDVVLGPATDGGYYLIGCRRMIPELFEAIDWGTSKVLSQTIARLSETTRRLGLLDPWYDVDTIAEWQMLRGHVAAMRQAGIEPGIPHTETKWLSRRDATT